MEPPEHKIYKMDLKIIEFPDGTNYCFVSGFEKITFIFFLIAQ